MRNWTRRGNTWAFRIPGRNPRGRLIPAILLIASGVITLLFVWMESPALPGSFEESALPVVWCVLLFAAVGILGCVELLGLWARYEVRFDLDTHAVAAVDRRARKTLWQASFDRQKLYLTETVAAFGYGIRHSPALAYGDSRQDLVVFDVPTVRRTMLTKGKKQRLLELMEQMVG